MDSEGEQEEAESNKNYEFYQSFFDHFKTYALHDYSNPERRKHATELLASLPGFSDHKKCQIAGVGWQRLQEKPERKMKDKEIEFYQFIVNNSNPSPEAYDFSYTSCPTAVFLAESAGYAVEDNTVTVDDKGNVEKRKHYNFKFKYQRHSMGSSKSILIDKYHDYIKVKYGDTGGKGTRRISRETADKIWPFFVTPAGPRDFKSAVCICCYNFDNVKFFVKNKRGLDKLETKDLVAETEKIKFEKNEKYQIQQLVEVVDRIDKNGKVVRKVQHKSIMFNPLEFVGLVTKMVQEVEYHHEVLSHERKYWPALLDQYLKDGYLVANCDYAMNWRVKSKVSSQKDHMDPTERSIHCNVVKFMDKSGEIQKVYVSHISDSKKHDNVLVAQNLVDVYRGLEQKYGLKFRGLVVKSDNCLCQYKSRYALGNYFNIAKKLGIPRVIICYGTASHGKCECDQLGGSMKTLLNQMVADGAEINTAEEMGSHLSTRPSKKVNKWVHIVPEPHIENMLSNYKIQPSGGKFMVKDIDTYHMIEFCYQDATIETTRKTKKKVINLPYKSNEFLTTENSGWIDRNIHLAYDYGDTKKFEYEKIDYYINKI